MILILEGLPGSGKTTIAEYLSKILGFKIVPQIISNNYQGQNFYQQSDLLKYKQAIRYAKQGYDVVIDRSHISTFAYNQARNYFLNISCNQGYAAESQDLVKQISDIGMRFLYIEIDLTLSATRKGRIFNHSNDYLWTNVEFLKLMDKITLCLLRSEGYPLVLLNGNDDFKNVKNTIRKLIETMKQEINLSRINDIQLNFQKVLYLFLNNDYKFWPDYRKGLKEQRYLNYVWKIINFSRVDLLKAVFPETVRLLSINNDKIENKLAKIISQFYIELEEKLVTNSNEFKNLEIKKRFFLKSYKHVPKNTFNSLSLLQKKVLKNRKYFKLFSVIGSYADGKYIKDWSDLDTIAIIKNEVTFNWEKLILLRRILHGMEKALLGVDKNQLHGHFVITETDLKYYPNCFMPLCVIHKSLHICKCGDLMINLRNCSRESKAIFKSSIVDYAKKLITQKVSFNNNHEAKRFMHRVFSLPLFFMQAFNQSCYKSESFQKAKRFLSPHSYSCIDELTCLMKNWGPESYKYLESKKSLFISQFNDLAKEVSLLIKNMELSYNWPVKLNNSDYEKTKNRLKFTYGSNKDIFSIYTYGNVDKAGISDLDLILVVKGNIKGHSVKLTDVAGLNIVDQYVIFHNPLILSVRLFRKINYILYMTDQPKLLWGNNIVINKISPPNDKYYKLAQLNFYFHHFYPHTFFGIKANPSSIRFSLLVLNALKHSVSLYQEINNKTKFRECDNLFKRVAELRKEWFNREKGVNFLLLIKLANEAYNYCQRLALDVNLYLKKEIYQEYSFPKKKILGVLRNMGIIFYNSNLVDLRDARDLTTNLYNRDKKIYSLLPEYFLLQLICFSKSNSGIIASNIKNNLRINFQHNPLTKNKAFKIQEEYIKILEELNCFHKRFIDIKKLYDYYNERSINITNKLVNELFQL